MRHCGVHWPNGPEKFGLLSSLPASLWLMTSPEARWHYDRMRKLGKVVVWRDVPAPGNRPAELRYDARRAADAAMTLWREQPHSGIEHFQSHCELTLNYERGDDEDDFANLDNRHRVLAAFLSDLEPQLRSRLPKGTLLHFPPWVPDGRSYDRLHIWKDVAERYDVISHHEYGPPEGIVERVQWHLDTWPTKGVILSEWHNDEPERTLELLAELSDREPRFLGATWFIAKWYGAPADWPAWKNLQDNEDLYRIFLNPPVATPAPEPEAPVYRVPARTPTYEEIRDGAIAVADGLGIPRRRLLGLCLAESGFGLQSFDRWASIERSKRMKAAIDAQDWRQVEAIFGEIKGSPTNDISFGCAHQSWWWSLTAEEQQAHPEWRHDLARIMDFRARMIEDHGTALDTAGRKVLGARPDLDLLCLYNKPAVPPLQNPNRTNYERSLLEADRLLAELFPSPLPPVTATVYERYDDPEPAGVLGSCAGVIFHGSRSGKAGNPLEREYEGTANYERSNSLGLGWNATIGPGRVALHLPADRWGWNARAASSRYVAVEIAQPTIDDPLPPSVAVALGDYIFDHVWPRWGEVWHFPSHAELEVWGETGQKDGKTDLYSAGDERMNVFRDLVYTQLRRRQEGAQPAPEPPAPPPSRAAVLVAEIEARLQELKGLVA